MWKIIGLPWPSSRMIPLKTKQILVVLKKPKKTVNPLKDKTKTYDKELGVEFPSSRFY